jgi:hypothetical protein
LKDRKATILPLALAVAVAAALAATLLARDDDPAPTTCTRFAAPDGDDGSAGTRRRPFRTAQRLVSSLRPGETGCLRRGTYSDASEDFVVRFDRGGRHGAPITLRSYPGERARLLGIVNVPAGSDHVRLAAVDIEGTGGENTVKIYATDGVVEDSDITNVGRGNSCMILGSNSGYGQAVRVIVRRNRFHDCGRAANDNKDHGIYAQNVVDGEIVGNVFWNSAAYAIQLYPNAQRTRFAHNIVDGDSPSVRGGVVFGGDSTYASNDNLVEHNVLAYAETYNITSTWGGLVGSGNVARNNCLWAGNEGNIDSSEGGLRAYANISADPRFMNRAKRDYRLDPDSSCTDVVGYDAAARLRSLPREARSAVYDPRRRTSSAGRAHGSSSCSRRTRTGSIVVCPDVSHRRLHHHVA